MSSTFSTYLRDTIGDAVGKLEKHRLLFLIGSGDVGLDDLARRMILGDAADHPVMLEKWRPGLGDELSSESQRGKSYYFNDLPEYLEVIGAEDLRLLTEDLSRSAGWKARVLFDMGISIDDTDVPMRVLAEVNAILNNTLFLVSPLPQRYSVELVEKGLSDAGIRTDPETAQMIRHDVAETPVSYTYIRLFVERVAAQLREASTRGGASSVLGSLEYETLGTLRHFIEYQGRGFLLAAGSLATEQEVEWLFRSMIVSRNEKTTRVSLTAGDASAVAGISQEKAAALLSLASDPRHAVLTKSGDRYFVPQDLHLEQWSDLKRWCQREVDSAELYGKYLGMARAYEQGRGALLTGTQIEEAAGWKDSTPLNPHWAARYHPEVEYTLGYVSHSEKAYQEFLDAQERVRSRRIRRAYAIAVASGVCVLMIGGLVVFAWQERNKALKAEQATRKANDQTKDALKLAVKRQQEADAARMVADSAKTDALTQAEIARQAREVAMENQRQALLAKEDALVQKKSAEDERSIAQRARDTAIEAQRIANRNREAAQKAEGEARDNFTRAERLSNRQAAKARVISVYEDYDNGKYEDGRNRALDAYEDFMRFGGDPYDRDFLTILGVGFFRQQKALTEVLQFSPARFWMSDDRSARAYLTLRKDVLLMRPGAARAMQVPGLRNVAGICGFGKSEFLVSAPGGLRVLGADRLRPVAFPQLGQRTVSAMGLLQGGSNPRYWLSTSDTLMLFGIDASLTARDVLKIPGGRVTMMRSGQKGHFFINGPALFELDLRTSSVRRVAVFRDNLTAVSNNFRSEMLSVADESGNLYIVNPANGEIVAERNKLHNSRISALEVVRFDDSDLEVLVTAGYDGAVNMFYFSGENRRDLKLPTPVNYREHRSWILDMRPGQDPGIIFTLGNDRTLRGWPLLPNKRQQSAAASMKK